MKLHFQLHPEDLVFFSMETTKRSPDYTKALRKKTILVSIFYLILTLFLRQHLGIPLITGAFLLMTLILMFLFPKIQEKFYTRHFRQFYQRPEHKLYLQKQTLELNKNGIVNRLKGMSGDYQWSTINYLLDYKNHYLILIEGNRGWVIPKNIFKNKKEQATFKSFFKKIPYTRMP